MKDEEKVLVYELHECRDGTLRIGNSLELPMSEARMLVEARKVKFPDCAIGVLPEDRKQAEDED